VGGRRRRTSSNTTSRSSIHGASGFTFEGAGQTEASETAYYAVPELVWKLGKHLELLVAVPVGLTRAAADYGVIVGITVEIEGLTGRGQRAD